MVSQKEIIDELGFMFGAAYGLMLKKKPRNFKEEKRLRATYDAIRRLIEQGRPKVSRGFVERWARIIWQDAITILAQGRGLELNWLEYITRLLREAGVGVEDDQA
jgi:hypothetical protein